MVYYKDIFYDDNWIFATAYAKGETGHIKVHRQREYYECDTKGNGLFQKGAWILREKVNKGLVKGDSLSIIAWY